MYTRDNFGDAMLRILGSTAELNGVYPTNERLIEHYIPPYPM